MIDSVPNLRIIVDGCRKHHNGVKVNSFRWVDMFIWLGISSGVVRGGCDAASVLGSDQDLSSQWWLWFEDSIFRANGQGLNKWQSFHMFRIFAMPFNEIYGFSEAFISIQYLVNTNKFGYSIIIIVVLLIDCHTMDNSVMHIFIERSLCCQNF